MALIWIVTIGSSDVQLDSNSVSQGKNRTAKNYSDKIWNYWYTDELKAQYNLPASAIPTRSFADKDETYRIPPRILGMLYRLSTEDIQQEILSYLMFPLLDNFVKKLQDFPAPETIVLLLTDQSSILLDDRQMQKIKSPYWQDTCELDPILRHYFEQKFGNIFCETYLLKPTKSGKGLDDWDGVLELVRHKFKDLRINNQEVNVSEAEKVYVSHQAGTPAISSAVQFCSLAKFGDRVQFLVSNEYNSELTVFVQSSLYLQGIKREQAKLLLKNHDYAGVNSLVGEYLDGNVKTLLHAAIKWNVARFSNFLDCISHYPELTSGVAERIRAENWWWIAYEEVYLSLVRMKQSNIVEAFFHSFRAFEGVFAAWGKNKLGEYFEYIKDIPYLNPSILDDSRDYFSGKRCKDVSDFAKLKIKLQNLKEKKTDEGQVELNMSTICKIFRTFRYKEYKSDCRELIIFWGDNNVCNKRNFIVHQVQGMSEEDLWNFWGVTSLEEWKSRLLKFLNFIVKEDLPAGFLSLEQGSLMYIVHQKLEEAVNAF